MSEVRYPVYYGTLRVSMAELRARFEPRMHPEFARRLFPWLAAQDGRVGIGTGYRTTQPDRPGFAPDGRSFHQTQRFASGFDGFAAVDLVHAGVSDTSIHRTIRWSEVPEPGSVEARRWGLHCNVGGEPWHMQPIEIRGWVTWVNAGRPDPSDTYPTPGRPDPPPPPPPPPDNEEDLMAMPEIIRFDGQEATFVSFGPEKLIFRGPNDRKYWEDRITRAGGDPTLRPMPPAMGRVTGRVTNLQAGQKLVLNRWGVRRGT